MQGDSVITPTASTYPNIENPSTCGSPYGYCQGLGFRVLKKHKKLKACSSGTSSSSLLAQQALSCLTNACGFQEIVSLNPTSAPFEPRIRSANIFGMLVIAMSCCRVVPLISSRKPLVQSCCWPSWRGLYGYGQDVTAKDVLATPTTSCPKP